MDFDYTDELENYFMVVFDINKRKFVSLVDKETRVPFVIETLDTEVSLEKLEQTEEYPVRYETVYNTIYEYFKAV